MQGTTIIAKSLAAAAALVVAGIAGAATATAGTAGQPVGGLTTDAGCSVSCIESALVSVTASSATVKVKTTVPTSTTGSVAKLDADLGLTTGVEAKKVTAPAFATERTLVFDGLEPDTSYRITITARDRAGRKSSRTGTFRTRAVKVAVETPTTDLSAGLGCKADCIASGTARAHPTVVGRVDFDVRLTEAGRAQLDLYISNGKGGLLLKRSIGSSNGIVTWKPFVEGLLTGTTYTVRVMARDARGQTHVEWGSIRTASARATVTYHRIDILDDGEVGRGEISFDYWLEDIGVGGDGFHKLATGDSFTPVQYGTSRPLVTIGRSIDGHTNLDVAVLGVECDGSIMKNCSTEAGHETTGEYSGDTYVMARAAFELRKLIDPQGALPAGHGTGLPAGHDGYLVWDGIASGLKFRVFATVDFEVVG